MLFQTTLGQPTWYTGHNIIEMFIRGILSHLWKTTKAIELERDSLLTCQVLGLLVSTVAADGKYLVLNRDNLTIPIQMQLSQKQKFFSRFFSAFLKAGLNLEHFEKKDDPHWFCIFEITDSEKVVRWMSKKSRFRGPFQNQDGKREGRLFKFVSQHLYHTHW